MSKPLTAEEEAKFRESVRMLEPVSEGLQWANGAVMRLLATLDAERLSSQPAPDAGPAMSEIDRDRLARAMEGLIRTPERLIVHFDHLLGTDMVSQDMAAFSRLAASIAAEYDRIASSPETTPAGVLLKANGVSDDGGQDNLGPAGEAGEGALGESRFDLSGDGVQPDRGLVVGHGGHVDDNLDVGSEPGERSSSHADKIQPAVSNVNRQDVERLAVALAEEGIAIENVASIGAAEQWLPDYDMARRILARLAGDPIVLPLVEGPCPACKGRRWANDENWQPNDPRTWDGSRSHGDGLIPCGFCNEGGWDTPDYEPAPAETTPAGVLALDAERLAVAFQAEIGGPVSAYARERAGELAAEYNRLGGAPKEDWQCQTVGCYLHAGHASEHEPGMCECGADMEAHSGGWTLLHHDHFMEGFRGAPAGVLDEAALRTALDIDWTPFWRETPIEEPDGVHSFMADFDRDAFAAAIAREYAASQPTPGTGLRTAAERLLATIRASHGPVRHYPCDICDRADALAAALGRSGSGGGRG